MIIERLPSPVLKLLGEVEALGFILTLVGGSPRDWLFADVVEVDLDFEIRAKSVVSISDWPLFYKRLPDFLASQGLNPKVLPYLITRVEVDGFSLEFSSPRTEVNLPDNFSHHHFEATLDSSLDYLESFRRRDLTINAIGLQLDVERKSETLVDPYQGAIDLKNGILRHVSDDYFNDSVRFLRLIRFQLKFNRFIMDGDLLNKLSRFNLSKLSVHYFKEELGKSDAGKFLNLFSELVKTHHLELSPEFQIWTKYTYPSGLLGKEEILGFVFLQNKEDAEKVAAFFQMPSKTMKDLLSFADSLDKLTATTKDLLETLAGKSQLEILAHPLMKECRNLEEKKIWIKHLHMDERHLAFGPSDWDGVTATPEELASLAPSVRSYYPYYKALLRKFNKFKKV